MNKATKMPSIYIPHGGGPAFFIQGEMREMFQPMADFLADLPRLLPAVPSAILVVSAHWETSMVTLESGIKPQLIYDYYGFPEEMYKLAYPAVGEPSLAKRAARLLSEHHIPNTIDAENGWDHGVFIPLMVMYPQANIPVVAMSLEQDMNPTKHIAIGRALAPLRDEGVLILGSGSSYHNLGQLRNSGEGGEEFNDWLSQTLSEQGSKRAEQLAQWEQVPSARMAHPREEHLLPLMVASSAGSDEPGRKIWQGNMGPAPVGAWAFD